MIPPEDLVPLTQKYPGVRVEEGATEASRRLVVDGKFFLLEKGADGYTVGMNGVMGWLGVPTALAAFEVELKFHQDMHDSRLQRVASERRAFEALIQAARGGGA